jgi:hypothetical protein
LVSQNKSEYVHRGFDTIELATSRSVALATARNIGVYYHIAAGRRPAEERKRKKATADLAVRERERRDRDMVLADEGPDDDFPTRR